MTDKHERNPAETEKEINDIKEEVESIFDKISKNMGEISLDVYKANQKYIDMFTNYRYVHRVERDDETSELVADFQEMVDGFLQNELVKMIEKCRDNLKTLRDEIVNQKIKEPYKLVHS